MTRRTLELPDAPGVWLVRDKYGFVYSCDVYSRNGKLCVGPCIEVEEIFGITWQGPITWEE